MNIDPLPGVNTAYVERHSEDAFIAWQCDMIPIEWAVRRQPFASFLRRNPHMKAGQICCPPPVELSFKVRPGGLMIHIFNFIYMPTISRAILHGDAEMNMYTSEVNLL